MSADDAAEFTDFVSANWSRLYRLAVLAAGSADQGEDCLQTTLVKAYDHWARIQGVENPSAYVRKMLLNTITSAHRRGRMARHKLALVPTERPPCGIEDGLGDRLALWAVVRALPPRQRAVVVLKFYEDLSTKEIADVLGCSTGTVKSQTSDALRTLGNALSGIPTSQERPS